MSFIIHSVIKIKFCRIEALLFKDFRNKNKSYFLSVLQLGIKFNSNYIKFNYFFISCESCKVPNSTNRVEFES